MEYEYKITLELHIRTREDAEAVVRDLLALGKEHFEFITVLDRESHQGQGDVYIWRKPLVSEDLRWR